jgi:hypothetical protein
VPMFVPPDVARTRSHSWPTNFCAAPIPPEVVMITIDAITDDPFQGMRVAAAHLSQPETIMILRDILRNIGRRMALPLYKGSSAAGYTTRD